MGIAYRRCRSKPAEAPELEEESEHSLPGKRTRAEGRTPQGILGWTSRPVARTALNTRALDWSSRFHQSAMSTRETHRWLAAEPVLAKNGWLPGFSGAEKVVFLRLRPVLVPARKPYPYPIILIIGVGFWPKNGGSRKVPELEHVENQELVVSPGKFEQARCRPSKTSPGACQP